MSAKYKVGDLVSRPAKFMEEAWVILEIDEPGKRAKCQHRQRVGPIEWFAFSELRLERTGPIKTWMG